MKISKTMALFTAALLFSGGASASAEKASNAERMLLCSAIDQSMQAEFVDAALDLESCLSNEEVISGSIGDGIRFVSASVTMNDPNRTFKQTCKLGYSGAPIISNVVNGLSAGVTCN